MATVATTKKFRIRMITPWTGMIDGVERTVRAGEEVDVDIDTFRALVFIHGKAEAVTVDEIVADAKKPKKPKKSKGTTASTIKGRRTPDKDKMLKTSTQKSGE